MSDDLRMSLERLKWDTIDAIERGRTPYMNSAALCLMFDGLLTRIEALEAAAESGTRE